MSCNYCSRYYNTIPTNNKYILSYLSQPRIQIKSKNIPLVLANVFVKFNLQYSVTQSKDMYQRLVLLKPNYNYLDNVLNIYLKYAEEYSKIINTNSNGYTIFIITMITYNQNDKTLSNFSMMFLKYKYVQNNTLIVDVNLDKNKAINNLMTILNNNSKVYSMLDFIIYPVNNLATLQNYIKYDIQLLTFINPPKHNEIIFDLDEIYIENSNKFVIFKYDNNNKPYCATYKFITNSNNFSGLMIKTNDNNNLYGRYNSGNDPCVNVLSSSLSELGTFIYNMVKPGDFIYLYYYDLSSTTFEYMNTGIKIKQLTSNINESTHINFVNIELKNYPNIFNEL